MFVTEVSTEVNRALDSSKPTDFQGHRIVEDHVDADELLEHREQNADPHDRLEPEPLPDEVTEGFPVLAADRVPDALDQRGGPEHPGEVAQHLGRFVLASSGDEEARGFGQRIRQQGGEDAGDDHQLLQRTEAAAPVGRGHLGDMGRSDHRGGTDAQPVDHPPDDEVGDAEDQPGADRGDEEQDRRHDHHRQTPVAIGQAAGEPGPERTGDECRGDGEALEPGTERELLGEGIDGAVEDRRVEADEETAESRGRGDADDAGVQPLGAVQSLEIGW